MRALAAPRRRARPTATTAWPRPGSICSPRRTTCATPTRSASTWSTSPARCWATTPPSSTARSIEAFQREGPRRLSSRPPRRCSTLIRDLDELLATRPEFLLGNWLEDARRWGTTDAERDRLEWNARRVLTLWGNGTVLRDYACRQWSGMLSGFYLKRWELFYRHLDEALAAGKPFDEKAFASEMFELEKAWSGLHDRYPRQPRGDSIAASRAGSGPSTATPFKPDAVSLTTGKPATCSSALPGYPAPPGQRRPHARNTDAYWATDVTEHPGPPGGRWTWRSRPRWAAWWSSATMATSGYYGFTVEASTRRPAHGKWSPTAATTRSLPPGRVHLPLRAAAGPLPPRHPDPQLRQHRPPPGGSDGVREVKFDCRRGLP